VDARAADTQGADSKVDTKSSDFERLELSVRVLVDRYLAQRDENTKLRTEIAARDRRIETLESELRRAQQSRREVAGRIDALLAEVERLESRFVGPAEDA
jgi:septal ring factor EnvC (AmiA/AmiB activator)